MAIRVTLLIKKVDDVSHEEFSRHWLEHGDLFANLAIVKAKMIKFSQFHTDKSVTDSHAALGLPVTEYDGGVDLWLSAVEDIMAIVVDREYNSVCVPDAKTFFKLDEAKYMIGHDHDFIVDSKNIRK